MYRYAVIEDQTLFTMAIDEKKYKIDRHELDQAPLHVGDLWELGQTFKFSHVWLMPSREKELGKQLAFSTGASQHKLSDYTYFIKWSGYKPGTREPKDTAVPLFARVSKMGIKGQNIYVGFSPFAEWGWQIETPADLLGTLYYLTIALDMPIEWGPGHMGLMLIKKMNQHRPEWTRECGSLNKISDELHGAARDLVWKRDAITSEFEGMYIHHFDKNSAYLAACTGVMVGAGEPIHRLEQDGIDASLPGIYRVSFDTGESSYDGRALPLIINTEWVTTQVLQTAIAAGYNVQIHETWQWEERHRTLESWARKVWEIRDSFHPDRGNRNLYPNELCRCNAYTTIKIIALVSVGRLGSRKTANQYMRPDWWAMVVGRARSTMFYKLDQLAEMGIAPCLIYSDGLFFLSYEESPEKAVPGMTTRGEKLGGYSYEYAVKVTPEVVERFNKLSPAGLVGYLNDLAEYSEGE